MLKNSKQKRKAQKEQQELDLREVKWWYDLGSEEAGNIESDMDD